MKPDIHPEHKEGDNQDFTNLRRQLKQINEVKGVAHFSSSLENNCVVFIGQM